jgi:hypothetical protein
MRAKSNGMKGQGKFMMMMMKGQCDVCKDDERQCGLLCRVKDSCCDDSRMRRKKEERNVDMDTTMLACDQIEGASKKAG